jgi:hypothetical protein
LKKHGKKYIDVLEYFLKNYKDILNNDWLMIISKSKSLNRGK